MRTFKFWLRNKILDFLDVEDLISIYSRDVEEVYDAKLSHLRHDINQLQNEWGMVVSRLDALESDVSSLERKMP